MWDGTFKEAYSNNPAWIYYDICTVDRYALGDRLTPLMVDKWSLYRLAQYCDEMVPDGLAKNHALLVMFIFRVPKVPLKF